MVIRDGLKRCTRETGHEITRMRIYINRQRGIMCKREEQGASGSNTFMVRRGRTSKVVARMLACTFWHLHNIEKLSERIIIRIRRQNFNDMQTENPSRLPCQYLLSRNF